MRDITDHYQISLNILKQLLEETGHRSWADWIAQDIELWRSKREVKHHLSAYGRMGSLNDLRIGGTDRLGMWSGEVFRAIKHLSWSLAKKRVPCAPKERDFYRSGTGEMRGWRCVSCGYSRMDEGQIESSLCFRYLPEIITDLLEQEKLGDLMPLSNWIDGEPIESERKKIRESLSYSGVELLTSKAWLNLCLRCESDDICACRWRWDDQKKTIVESKS